MGIGKLLKNNMFWGEDKDETSEDVKSTQPQTPAESAPVVTTTYQSPDSALAAINPKFVQHFADLMKAANFNGPDYQEASIAMKNLATIAPNMSETDMFKSIIGTIFMGAGVNPIVIVESADRYIREVFEPDRKEMMSEIDRVREETIGEKNRQIKSLGDKRLDTEREIKRLQDSLSGFDTEISKLNAEVSVQEQKLQRKTQEYVTTYDAQIAQIRSDQNKIRRIIENKG